MALRTKVIVMEIILEDSEGIIIEDLHNKQRAKETRYKPFKMQLKV